MKKFKKRPRSCLISETRVDREEGMELVEKTELLLKDETYAVTGAAIEVHRALGPGSLEKYTRKPCNSN